ncbi:hypothetical protein ACFWW0_43020, partial [Streptomyces violascens]
MTTTTAPLLSAAGLRVTFPGRRGAPPARAVDGVEHTVGAGGVVAPGGGGGGGAPTPPPPPPPAPRPP